jgi:hypothetical protein
MRYYRNVEIDYDNTVEKKQERDYDDIPIITGGIDLPDSSLDIPLVEADLDGFSVEEAVDEDAFISDAEEVFETEALADDLDVDDDF